MPEPSGGIYPSVPDKRLRALGGADKPDVGQFQDAFNKDDVRGLDVAMNKSLFVQVTQRIREGQADTQTFLDGQSPP